MRASSTSLFTSGLIFSGSARSSRAFRSVPARHFPHRRQRRDCIGLDLELVVAHHDLADDLDYHVKLDLGVGTDTGLDEGSDVLGAGLVDDGKDGGTACLLDLGYLAFDGNGLALLRPEVCDLNGRGLALDLLDLVYLDQHLFEINVAVGPDLPDPDKDAVLFLVLGLDACLVHEALDPVVELDKHPKGCKALDLPEVGLSLLYIGQVAACGQPVYHDIRICFHFSLHTHSET